jgi:hypothetical protein
MTEKQIKVPILTKIQNELKAPKNQYNSYGKYKYRNAEDIEQALKPLLAKYGATLYIDEEPRQVGERIYFVETVHYKDQEQTIEVNGWAREPDSKKGMDDSQLSGSTSSYATKYALGKLFLVDDTQDADAQRPSQARQSYQRRTTTNDRQARQTAPAAVPASKPATAKANTGTASEDAKLVKWQVNYLNQQTPLVEIVKSMAEGDKSAQKFLHGLTGHDRVAASEIYKRNLYLGA